MPGNGPCYMCSHSTAENFVPWPHLFSGESGKYRRASGFWWTASSLSHKNTCSKYSQVYHDKGNQSSLTQNCKGLGVYKEHKPKFSKTAGLEQIGVRWFPAGRSREMLQKYMEFHCRKCLKRFRLMGNWRSWTSFLLLGIQLLWQ